MEQLSPLVDVATPDTDEEWAHREPAMTPAALEAMAKQRRRVKREDAERQHGRRSFRWWKDRHGLRTCVAGLLPDDAAAILTGRVSAIAEEAGHADVVVQVPVGVEGLQPTLGDGTVIRIDTIHRLAGDGTSHLLVENPDGSVAGYGQRRRIVPDEMRQRLRRRDRHRLGTAAPTPGGSTRTTSSTGSTEVASTRATS